MTLEWSEEDERELKLIEGEMKYGSLPQHGWLAGQLRAALTELARRDARKFPVMDAGAAPSRVPWSWVAEYEGQALENHSQDITTLASRGGLCPRELWAVVHGVRNPRDLPKRLDASAWLESRPWLRATPPTPTPVAADALFQPPGEPDLAPGEMGRTVALVKRFGGLSPDQLLSPEARAEGDRVLAELAAARRRAADQACVTPLERKPVPAPVAGERPCLKLTCSGVVWVDWGSVSGRKTVELLAGLCPVCGVLSVSGERSGEFTSAGPKRCERCGWPLAASADLGCVEGDCSMRGIPEPALAPVAPPDELVGALHDRVHKEIGVGRPAKSMRVPTPAAEEACSRCGCSRHGGCRCVECGCVAARPDPLDLAAVQEWCDQLGEENRRRRERLALPPARGPEQRGFGGEHGEWRDDPAPVAGPTTPDLAEVISAKRQELEAVSPALYANPNRCSVDDGERRCLFAAGHEGEHWLDIWHPPAAGPMDGELLADLTHELEYHERRLSEGQCFSRKRYREEMAAAILEWAVSNATALSALQAKRAGPR